MNYQESGGVVAGVLTPQSVYNIDQLAQVVLETGGAVFVSEGIDLPEEDTSDVVTGYHKNLASFAAEQHVAEQLQNALQKIWTPQDALDQLRVRATKAGYGQRVSEPVEADIEKTVRHVCYAISTGAIGLRNSVIMERDHKLEIITIPDFVSINRTAEKSRLMQYHLRLQLVLEELKASGVYVGEFK